MEEVRERGERKINLRHLLEKYFRVKNSCFLMNKYLRNWIRIKCNIFLSKSAQYSFQNMVLIALRLMYNALNSCKPCVVSPRSIDFENLLSFTFAVDFSEKSHLFKASLSILGDWVVVDRFMFFFLVFPRFKLFAEFQLTPF